eukprot:6180428-Pleurochrysis_carterae.AAC.1
MSKCPFSVWGGCQALFLTAFQVLSLAQTQRMQPAQAQCRRRIRLGNEQLVLVAMCSQTRVSQCDSLQQRQAAVVGVLSQPLCETPHPSPKHRSKRRCTDAM